MMTQRRRMRTQPLYNKYPEENVFMNNIYREHEMVNGMPVKDVDVEHKYNNGIETIQGHYNNNPIYMYRESPYVQPMMLNHRKTKRNKSKINKRKQKKQKKQKK